MLNELNRESQIKVIKRENEKLKKKSNNILKKEIK